MTLHILMKFRVDSLLFSCCGKRVKLFGGIQNSMILRSTTKIPVQSERISSSGISLDPALLAENPELVLSHIKSRRGNPSLLNDVQRIGELRSLRNSAISQGNLAKSTRNNLSQEIGKLMKMGRTNEIDELKLQVEKAKDLATQLDMQLNDIDREMNDLLSMIPNLLDDR